MVYRELLDATALFGTSHSMFRARYCVLGGYNGHDVIAHQNEKELRDLFYSVTHRRDRDVLDLPEAQHVDRRAELPPAAWRLYEELARELVADIEGGRVTARNALTMSVKLRQICCGHVRADDGAWRQVHHVKEELLAEAFDELPAEEPVEPRIYQAHAAREDAIQTVLADPRRALIEGE